MEWKDFPLAAPIVEGQAVTADIFNTIINNLQYISQRED